MFRIYAALTGLLRKDLSSWKTVSISARTEKDTIWFHAASAGELEILVPVIEATLKKGRKACVSVFSNSAVSALAKLPEELLYRGFSPAESDWEDALRRFGVSEVITSKYEAWPGLWRAGSRLNIRITVMCAQLRSSLRWAKRLLGWMHVDLPKLRFFALEESSAQELQDFFPSAQVILSADPRWLRVLQRSAEASRHPRLQKWIKLHESAPRPYWVIGSAWPEDMSFLREAIRGFRGTVWVVPHSLKDPLSKETFTPEANCILVDEMGMLVELYSIADRVWVGGGWGKGVHSTLEPAVYSIPVACGPNEVEKFYECKELMAQGVLTVCRASKEVKTWLDRPFQPIDLSLNLKMKRIDQAMEEVTK